MSWCYVLLTVLESCTPTCVCVKMSAALVPFPLNGYISKHRYSLVSMARVNMIWHLRLNFNMFSLTLCSSCVPGFLSGKRSYPHSSSCLVRSIVLDTERGDVSTKSLGFPPLANTRGHSWVSWSRGSVAKVDRWHFQTKTLSVKISVTYSF